jgi:phosphatidate phosphatase PAH1
MAEEFESESSLSKSVLNSESTMGIFPFDGTIDTGDLAGAAFQTAGKFDHHLSLLVQSIEVCRTGINAKTFFAVMTDFLVKLDMGFFIILKGI